jgi:hypothetical protein
VVGKEQVSHFDTGFGEESEEFLRIGDHLGLGPVTRFREFAPKLIEAEFGQAALGHVLLDCRHFELDPLPLAKVFDILFSIFGTLRTSGITIGFRFQLQTPVAVLDEESFTGLGVVLCYPVFVKHEDFEYTLSSLNRKTHFLNFPRGGQSPLRRILMTALLLTARLRARPAQTE